MFDDSAELQKTVERLHGCKAVPMRVTPVTERWEGKVVWDGLVHIYKLEGHPTAERAYAWSSPIPGSDKRRVSAVLHAPPIDSAQAAIRAEVHADHRGGKS